MSSIYIYIYIYIYKLINLFLWFCKCAASIHLINMSLSGIIAIINSINKSKSLCQCFFEFYFCLSVTSCNQLHPPVFHGIPDEVYDFLWYFVHLPTLLFTFVEPYYQLFCSQSIPWLHFLASFWVLWGCAGLEIVVHLSPLSLDSILSCSSYTAYKWFIEFFSYLCSQNFLHHR